MPPLLVVEDLDVIEQRVLRLAMALEPFSELELQRREPAFHYGVVVALAATTHAAGDAAGSQGIPVVLARIGAALVRVVHQSAFVSPPSQRLLKRSARQMPVIHGAYRPAHADGGVDI